MSPDLRNFLILISVCVPFGMFLGFLLRKKKPDWCKTYAKFCMDGKWSIYAFGFLFFTAMGALSLSNDRPYFSGLFGVMAALNGFGFFKFGFRRLTPEEEATIDQSDPTSFRPFRFWKTR